MPANAAMRPMRLRLLVWKQGDDPCHIWDKEGKWSQFRFRCHFNFLGIVTIWESQFEIDLLVCPKSWHVY